MEGTLKIAYDMVRNAESLKTLTSLQNPICTCLLNFMKRLFYAFKVIRKVLM